MNKDLLTKSTLKTAAPIKISKGELRKSNSIGNLINIASTGHKIVGTYHSTLNLNPVYEGLTEDIPF